MYLPELQNNEASDESVIKRPRREQAKIVGVPRLVPLIAGADFLGEDFRKRQTCERGRRERQEPEITLLELLADKLRRGLGTPADRSG
jgi:hypothetical protein